MSRTDTHSSIPLPTDVAGGPQPTPAEESDVAPVVGRHGSGNETYATLVWRRFRRSPMGMIGLVLVAALLIMSIFADFFAPMDPKQTNLPFAPPDLIAFEDAAGNFSLLPHIYPIGDTGEFDPIPFQPLTGPVKDDPTPVGFFVEGYSYNILWVIPSNIHFFGSTDGRPLQLLGTDKFGRDILSRGIIGSRISLMIALAVVTITTIVGTLVGITSGYIGGRLDAWVQRFVEFVLAFPQLPLYLALTSLIPVTAPSNVFLTFVIFVMAVLGWAQLSREVRSKTLSLARIEYVRAAIAVGASDRRIILRHLLPNVLSHIIVSITLAIPAVVIGSYPWILTPVIFVLITVFAFNALGDGLRDAVDPY